MHETSLLRKVLLKIYSKFLRVSKTVKMSMMLRTIILPGVLLGTPPRKDLKMLQFFDGV